MNKYIFYTGEGSTYDPDGNEVQNCQLLGCAYGDNRQEAQDNLMKDNPWISEHNFDEHNFMCQELAVKG